MTIQGIENGLIAAIRGLNAFRTVESIGRKDRPQTLNYPAAFVFFAGDKDTGTRPRPVYDTEFYLLIINKNLTSSAHAAKDTYELLDAVRDAVQGKTLGISNIEPFVCVSRELTAYDNSVSVIEYTLRVSTRLYLPVPAG